MDLQTLEMGNILLAKYRLCENMLEYMSDPDAVMGQKYKEQCGEFFKVFHDEMLVFTHELMTKCGEQFAELHCSEHSEQPDVPTPPTEPKEQKFTYGEKVEITNGDYKDKNGMVMGFDDTNATYYVVSPQFSMWFPESDLKAYVEESEEKPEEPTLKFKDGDIVKILSGEATGKLAKVVYCDSEDKTYRVEPIDDDFVGDLWYSEDSLELYVDPETPEENGAGDADPIEGE